MADLYELTATALFIERREGDANIHNNTIRLNYGYRIDFVVEKTVVIELKTVEAISPVHTAQTLACLKVGNYLYCLLININIKLLKEGIKRFINSACLR